MEDENLLDDDIIVRETQDNSPTTFSRNLVNRLGLSSQQNRTETVSINNNNNISNFAWLMTCKTFLEYIYIYILHHAQIFSNDKVMSNLLLLQIWTLYVFPNKNYKALKWQIWKCELGRFSFGRSHLILMV